MLTPSKIKKTVKNNTRIALYYTGGLAVGFAVARGIYKPSAEQMRALVVDNNALIDACKDAGLTLYGFTASEEAKLGLKAAVESL